MVEPAHTPNAPPVAGAYSPAVRAGDWLVLAGQVGFDVSTGQLAAGGTAGEARQAFVNVTTVLADCGAGWADVAKVTIFLADMADFPSVNEVYGEFVEKNRPARTTVQVAALPIGARIEVEVWAYKPA
ncbi:MAG TPA: Rid family detoxifying hydrolase [Acidimicrobiia bacterium]|jgi:2-iminobutanoate/2-iminopropanoate deaminase